MMLIQNGYQFSPSLHNLTSAQINFHMKMAAIQDAKKIAFIRNEQRKNQNKMMRLRR